MPSTLALPRAAHSMAIQVSAALAAAQCVFGEGQARATIGRQRRARVESEPAHPQQRGTGDGQRKVVRKDRIRAVSLALAQHDHAGETGDAGIDVHHGAAGEVEHAQRSAASHRATTPSAPSARRRTATTAP